VLGRYQLYCILVLTLDFLIISYKHGSSSGSVFKLLYKLDFGISSKAEFWLIRGMYHSTWAALTLCVLNN
jgi:hypothetical protein